MVKKIAIKVDGYKTYAACLALIAYAVIGVAIGKVDGATAGQYVIEALAIAGLRAAK